MAEAVGIAASGMSIITLAAQMLDGAIKLKTFWNSMKGAPQEIAELADQMEELSEMFSILPCQHDPIIAPIVARCVKRCEEEIEALSLLAQKHDRQVRKNRRWGTLKHSLDKKILSSHKASLGEAKSNLSLALHFSNTLKQLETSDNMSETAVVLSEQQGAGSLCQCTNTLTRRHTSDNRRRQRHRILFRTPSWFFNKAWEISSLQAYSGWTFTLRSLNVIPFDSPIFRYSENGDLQALRDLFSQNVASPFDCNEYGRTALQLAAGKGEIEVCRFLLREGADINHRDFDNSTALGFVNGHATKWIKMKDTTSVVDLYRLFASAFDYECFRECHRYFPAQTTFAGPPETLKILQQSLYLDYKQLPLIERFEWAMSIDTWWSAGTTASMIQTALAMESIEPQVYHLRSRNGETLLFIIARCLATALSENLLPVLDGWRRLLAQAVSAKADLSPISTRYDGTLVTPFCEFTQTFHKNTSKVRRPQYDFTPVIQLWIAELHDAGVDLMQYGVREHQLYMQESYQRDYLIDTIKYRRRWGGRLRRLLNYHWISFSFGPSAADWRVWTSNPLDESVGEFWDMLDHPERQMPGAWLDFNLDIEREFFLVSRFESSDE